MMKLQTKDGLGALLRTNKQNRVSSDGQYLIGYASIFGVLDADKDITQPGTFSRSLSQRPQVPFLRMHDMERPVGVTTILTEDSTGLLFRAKISNTQDGLELLELVGDGVLTQMSIGYSNAVRQRTQTNGEAVNRLVDLDLWEISGVLYGSNDQTTVALGKTGRYALLDAITVADYEQREKNGERLSQWEQQKYLQACSRQVERDLFGKTCKQLRYERLFSLQQEIAEIERLLR